MSAVIMSASCQYPVNLTLNVAHVVGIASELHEDVYQVDDPYYYCDDRQYQTDRRHGTLVAVLLRQKAQNKTCHTDGHTAAENYTADTAYQRCYGLTLAGLLILKLV